MKKRLRLRNGKVHLEVSSMSHHPLRFYVALLPGVTELTSVLWWRLSVHMWTQGSTRLKISKPNWMASYTLGDLKNYLEIMVAFHAKYEVYWEWHAQLITRGRWGSANAVGTGKLEIY